MDHIQWTEKSIELRKVIDDATIRKPILVKTRERPILVGAKLNGEFIVASPCTLINNQMIPMEQEILLSSKYNGLWKVISKGTSNIEDHIHRLTTKNIQEIFINDITRQRPLPRSYVCLKQIKAFDLITHKNDPTVADGKRIKKTFVHIEKNVEFEICEMGEAEYTPTEGERTSQDYTVVQRSRSRILRPFLKLTSSDGEYLVRNRAIRSLYCRTKNEYPARYFYLEVNEQPCDIRPIASLGSIELRYLHCTENLFNYMFIHQNETHLYVKLYRGDLPRRTEQFDGYMVLKRALVGDKVPICRVNDFELAFVSPDIPIRVKLPMDESQWRSIPDIRTAELKCMQLSLALLSRHESETNVIVEVETNKHHPKRPLKAKKASGIEEKSTDENEPIAPPRVSKSQTQEINNLQKLRFTKSCTINNPRTFDRQTVKARPSIDSTSNMFYEKHEEQTAQNNPKNEQQHAKIPPRSHQNQRRIIPNLSLSTSSSSSAVFNHHKNKVNIS